MNFEIVASKNFEKSMRRFPVWLQGRVWQKLELLSKNPAYPSLRTKAIRGQKGIYECSVNMDIRILWYYQGDKVIVALDVGHHDILKKF